MDRLVPLSAFEHEIVGVLAVGAHGEVRFCNHAAARLLHCDPDCARFMTCWRLTRLKTPAGEPFCGADCRIQREARAGILAQSHRVRRVPRTGSPVEIELVTFLVPPPQAGRFPLLHLLRTVDATTAASAAQPPSTTAIGPLSPREMDVLRLLADGLDDGAIADRLFISPVTVRNHLQNIFHKLGVHRRLDAVLTLLRQPH